MSGLCSEGFVGQLAWVYHQLAFWESENGHSCGEKRDRGTLKIIYTVSHTHREVHTHTIWQHMNSGAEGAEVAMGHGCLG